MMFTKRIDGLRQSEEVRVTAFPASQSYPNFAQGSWKERMQRRVDDEKKN